MTESIPITSIKGNPATGEIESFTVKSDKKWDKKRPDQSNGLSGEVDVKKRKASIKSSYTSGGANPTITSYTFATEDKKPEAPKKDRGGKPFSMVTRIPGDDSVDFDAITGILSIHSDAVTQTPTDGDALLGAAVNFPDLLWTGLTTDGQVATFWPATTSLFTMTTGMDVMVEATLGELFYSVPDNLFFAALSGLTLAGMSPSSPFYNAALSVTPSQFLTSIDSILNPDSAEFAPFADFYLTISPDVNVLALTDHFTASGSTGADDLHFLADRTVPEPATWPLVLTGSLGVLVRRRGGDDRKHQRSARASLS